jgi:two-component system chemotaxis response regulator CheY
MKVLIVDDSPLVRQIMVQLFTRQKVEDVDQAENGLTALELIGSSTYDLIMLDWKLPDKDGIEVLSEIREAANKVPVIMVTADSEKTQIMKAIKAGANGQEAVDKVREVDYDLVLLDWNMPEKLGIDVLKEIRASGNKVPIIMVTTESEKDNIIKAIRAGANSYIVKPFVPSVVLEKIKKVVPSVK